MSVGTVAGLIRKLRKMHGHLSARDRETLVETIEALTDLSIQLWELKGRPVPATALRAVKEETDGTTGR